MGIIAWVIFGALAGWIASIITGTNERFGALANIALGIVGAFIGGLIFNLFGASGVNDFNLYSMLVAVVGATLVIFLMKALSARA